MANDGASAAASTVPTKRRRTNSMDKNVGQHRPRDDDQDTPMPEAAPYENGASKAITSSDSAESSKQWQETIEKVVKSVVSIRFSQVSAFDTEGPETSEATGFIVDAERGYILTNRHVACAGPFVGHAICENHEEVEVFPVYRDPIHDFGILKFDPKAIKYMPVIALPIRPELVRVGLEIRVVGNDAGEKLSILAGFISRTDRNAPEYGDLTYCDFNTNYIQAAASATGGSSGSPVIALDGSVVALQAGGRTAAATDFFLPLDRPLRALQCIQQEKPITRGTIQTQFLHKPFDECRRLGLSAETEADVRGKFPEEIGMLVAEVVLEGGPAWDSLQEGDIMISLNGQLCTKFIPLESTLDESVGKDVEIVVQRGGQNLTFTLSVGDKHAITPDRYVEFSGAKFNNLSYQLARSYAIPVKGVYVCEPAGAFRLDGPDHGWIVESVDHKPVPDLDTFITVVREIPDRARVVVQYRSIHDMHSISTSVVQIDRHWSASFRLAVRNDKTGLWDFTDLGKPRPPVELKPRTARFVQMDKSLGAAGSLVKSFVKVHYYMPCRLDGFPRSRKSGTALVVDKERGLCVVSRSNVPFDMGDLSLTFADSIIVPGKIVFLHPTQNFGFIQYDPKLIGETPVEQAQFSEKEIEQGHTVSFVGFNHNNRIVATKTSVADVTAVTIPQNSTPRFRAVNLDSISVDSNLAAQCGSGVLADEEGKVQALWLTYLGERTQNGHDTEYRMGLPIGSIYPVLERLKQGKRVNLRILGVELFSVLMSTARNMGLSDDWVRKVEEANPVRHQLFMVRRVEAGYERVLEDGDLILAINGQPITRTRELDVQYDNEVLDITVLRKSEVVELKVPTLSADTLETDRVVFCFGALLQPPHHAVRQQSKKLHSGIYISGRSRGSPAYEGSGGGLVPTMWITHVDETPTPDLTTFLDVVRPIPDNTYVRIKTMSFDNVPFVISLRKREHYFPTVELVKDESAECGWRAIKIGKDGEEEEGIVVHVDGLVEDSVEMVEDACEPEVQEPEE
ncbi:hypothetical protein YB2330_003160 [Saitoella coloradoensis]